MSPVAKPFKAFRIHSESGRIQARFEQLTLADLSIAAVYGCAVPGKAPTARYANLQNWFTRMQTLETWRRSEQLARVA